LAVAIVALFAVGSWLVYGRRHFMSKRGDMAEEDMAEEPVTESGESSRLG
jgi:hypothetical protein